jgi:hypothetical protein
MLWCCGAMVLWCCGAVVLLPARCGAVGCDVWALPDGVVGAGLSALHACACAAAAMPQQQGLLQSAAEPTAAQQAHGPMPPTHPSPLTPTPTTCRALCHLKLQQPRPAAQLAGEVLYHNPGHARALYLLGSARLALRQYGPAAEALKRAAQAAPGDALVAGQLRRAVELGRREKQRRMRAMAAGCGARAVCCWQWAGLRDVVLCALLWPC